MQEESIIKKCDYLEDDGKKRMLLNNTFINQEPVFVDKCTHPQIEGRKRYFFCEPNKHEWCPFFGLINEDRD